MASRRQSILAEAQRRLALILTAGGFQTDAGATVFLGERGVLGDDDGDSAIALVPGDEDLEDNASVGAAAGTVVVGLRLQVEALALRTASRGAQATIEALIADIKTAMEATPLDFGGLLLRSLQRLPTRALPRQQGSQTVGAAVGYAVWYLEVLGDPNA